MIETRNCINLYSKWNTWIDFCILIPSQEDFEKAKEIVQKAYDDWWEDSDAQYETIGDYIGIRLSENDIEYEIYFKMDDKEKQ